MALFGRDQRTERRGSPIDFLIVGLGNPGKEYARTRHNVGEDTVVLLASRLGATLKSSRDKALTAEVTLNDHRCLLAFPITYMNESGQAVGALCRRYAIDDPAKLIIVHDELDLAPAVVRVKVGGGLAGHNGLRSITQHLKTQDYLRVRIGVGKPPSKEHGAKHVLSKLSKADREALDVAVQVAADAVETIVSTDVGTAMQRFNGL